MSPNCWIIWSKEVFIAGKLKTTRRLDYDTFVADFMVQTGLLLASGPYKQWRGAGRQLAVIMALGESVYGLI
jgi:hypothetical protein